MKCNIFICLLSALFLNGFCAFAQQQEEEPDIYLQAEQEADRLQGILKLEDWQTFYVDSTLKHDYPAMIAEMEKLQEAKVANTSLFQSVQDKWMEQIDATYQKIFTEAQWKAYLKSGASREQKARAKRKAKAEGK